MVRCSFREKLFKPLKPFCPLRDGKGGRWEGCDQRRESCPSVLGVSWPNSEAGSAVMAPPVEMNIAGLVQQG
jgi:hypothetical protein